MSDSQSPPNAPAKTAKKAEGAKPAGQSSRPKARSGRPAQVGLTREQILDAALALIDHKGLSSFSMRDLSRSLGVYPASIYWHVGGSKAQLFGEISSRITATVMTPAEACADWRDTLRTFFQRYRAAVAKHPNVAPLLGAQLQSNGLPNAPMVEIVLQALQQAGYQGQGLVDAFNAVIGGLAGFVTMEFGPAPPEDHEGWAATLRDQMDGLDPATFPAISGLLPLLRNRAFVLRWQNGSDVPLDGGFSCLVESLIRGLERSAP